MCALKLAEEYVHFHLFAVSYEVSLALFGLEVNSDFLSVLAVSSLTVVDTVLVEIVAFRRLWTCFLGGEDESTDVSIPVVDQSTLTSSYPLIESYSFYHFIL